MWLSLVSFNHAVFLSIASWLTPHGASRAEHNIQYGHVEWMQRPFLNSAWGCSTDSRPAGMSELICLLPSLTTGARVFSARWDSRRDRGRRRRQQWWAVTFCYGTVFLMQSNQIMLLLKRNSKWHWAETVQGPLQGQRFCLCAYSWWDLGGVDVSQLVMEAFLNHGDIAQREEKFLRFLAHLYLHLKAKCLKQGATEKNYKNYQK